jgi:ubiquinone/menaquinone biosynthesis C-methylase UbiE
MEAYMNRLERLRSPAEVYDESFVPALFAQWGPIVAAQAEVRKGDRVLDVACGTGALTVGLDANPEMLAVARRKPTRIEWLEGKAETLPLPDGSFDAVVSQFGFMFFDDKPAALRHMMRVLRSGGRLAVAVCDAVENSPGYSAFAQLLDRLFGKEVGDAFRAPFALGDAERLREIAREAGIADPKVARHHAAVEFKSIEALVSTERACVWTLGGVLTDEQFERLRAEAELALQPFVIDANTVRFDMPSLILTARKS